MIVADFRLLIYFLYFVIEGCKVTALFSNYQIFLSEKVFFLRFIWSYRIKKLYLQNQNN